MASENIAPHCWSPPMADADKHSLGPRRQGLQEIQRNCMPATPDEHLKKYEPQSDDLLQTSELDQPIEECKSQKMSERPMVIVGRRDQSVTLGRGGASTVKIGKRNRQISRVHVSITFNASHGHFELTVLGLNGARVDRLPYAQHETAPLEDGSFIDVLGDHIVFRCPPMPLNFEDQDKKRPFYPNNATEITTTLPAAPNPQAEEPQDPAPLDVKADREPAKEQKEEKETPKAEEQNVSAFPLQSLSPSIPSPALEEEEEQDYAEVIIDALVFSRKASMPISDICSRVLKTNPAYQSQSREMWEKRIGSVLKQKVFFGEIVRKGKTADGSPKENLYYYNPDKDPVEWRRSTYTQVGRSARKCTLQDKQYFWRIPPKLGRNRNAYIPPTAKDLSDEDASLLKRSRPKKEDEPVKKPKV